MKKLIIDRIEKEYNYNSHGDKEKVIELVLNDDYKIIKNDVIVGMVGAVIPIRFYDLLV